MTQLTSLPRFVRDLLSSCPVSGNGVHQWLFRVARVLHPFYMDKAGMVALIEGAAAGCGRDIPLGEIEAAVANSQAHAWKPGAKKARVVTGSRWPQRNKEQIEAITADAPGLVDLWETSPVRFDEDPCSEAIVDALFPGNPLICCGRRLDTEFATGHREEWCGQLASLQFIVPSPMIAKEGLTRGEGKLSARTLDNTGPRRFLVIEFDQGHTDAHAAVLWHLACMAPLVLAVHSGGKSLHGWFACVGQTEEKLLRFMRFAVSLGADPATWTRCQFVRMPDGIRPGLKRGEWARRQQVFYFNQENLP